MSSPGDLSERFRALVAAMVREDGKHGAKKRVAERLGVHPSDISKILSGKRRVGPEVATRAMGLSGAALPEAGREADPEAHAIATLGALAPAERTRVIRYAVDRWGDES